MRISAIAAVFVPFEVGFDGLERKRDDLPRFLTAEEVKQFLQRNRKLAKYRLTWKMHSERDLIEEFVKGVGVRAASYHRY